MTERIKIDQGGLGAGIWIIGWLFTIGFVDLGFRAGFLAFFVWPYYLGVRLAEMAGF